MKHFKITESERNSILRKYNLINEQASNKTVCDIQRLAGSSVDNVFGTNTFDAVMAILNRKFADQTKDGGRSGGKGVEPDYYEY